MVASLRALTFGLLVLGLGVTPFAMAAPAQQNKMKACNKEAGEKSLKGDERKQFMSDCLSN
jgi:hypothetical protein